MPQQPIGVVKTTQNVLTLLVKYVLCSSQCSMFQECICSIYYFLKKFQT